MSLINFLPHALQPPLNPGGGLSDPFPLPPVFTNPRMFFTAGPLLPIRPVPPLSAQPFPPLPQPIPIPIPGIPQPIPGPQQPIGPQLPIPGNVLSPEPSVTPSVGSDVTVGPSVTSTGPSVGGTGPSVGGTGPAAPGGAAGSILKWVLAVVVLWAILVSMHEFGGQARDVATGFGLLILVGVLLLLGPQAINNVKKVI